MVLRDELYFEPRVVSEFGGIRWYGGTYSSKKIVEHCTETVYIRDTGEELYIYSLSSDDLLNEKEVKATFTLIDKVPTHDKRYRYGKKVK
ncbi:MAG: hypothetical protein ACLUU0_11675 [Anaerostipes hadrus]